MNIHSLTLLLFCFPQLILAQQFSTLVVGEDRFFLDSDSLNTALHVVDSATVADGVAYYFYKDLRPAVYGDGSGCQTDTTCAEMGWFNGGPDVIYRTDGAGWLGEKMVKHTDGMDIYFNLDGDSIFVKTDAALHEKWRVFGAVDDTVIYGEVVDIAAFPVMNSIEDCKTIELQAAYQGLPVQHAMNGKRWVLSQTNGWVNVHSLYWFPNFPLPTEGIAYECSEFSLSHEQFDTGIFVLTKFEPLSFDQMFPLQIGDVFQIREGKNINYDIVFKFTTYSVTDVAHYQDSVVAQFDTQWFQQWDGEVGAGARTMRWLYPSSPFPRNSVSGHDRYVNGKYQRIHQGVEPEFHVGTSESDTDVRTWFEELEAQCGMYVVSALWESNVFLEGGCGVYYSQADMCYGSEFWFQGIPFEVYSKGCAGGYIEQVPTYASTGNCQFGTLQYLGVDDVQTTYLKLSPNPSSDLLHFQSSTNGTYSIMDIQGRTISSDKAVLGKNELDVNTLPSGVYLLQLQTDNGISSARFIKN